VTVEAADNVKFCVVIVFAVTFTVVCVELSYPLATAVTLYVPALIFGKHPVNTGQSGPKLVVLNSGLC
jgi:hypothetical protein